MHAKPLQSCPTLCHPMNYSLPGSFVCGISQARSLEWVTISFSKGSSWSRDQTWAFGLAGGFFTTEPPGKPLLYIIVILLLYSTLCTPHKQKSQKSPLSSWGTGLGRMSRWYPWSPPTVPVVWSIWDWGIRTVEPVWGLEKPVPCLQSAFCPGPGLWLLSSLVGIGSAHIGWGPWVESCRKPGASLGMFCTERPSPLACVSPLTWQCWLAGQGMTVNLGHS